MNLQIDKIANLIDKYPLPTKKGDVILGAFSDNIYITDTDEILYDVDENLCYAYPIANNIINSYVIQSNKSFKDIIEECPYDKLFGCGFLNGIPYFKSCVNPNKIKEDLQSTINEYHKPNYDDVINRNEELLKSKPILELKAKVTIYNLNWKNHVSFPLLIILFFLLFCAVLSIAHSYFLSLIFIICFGFTTTIVLKDVSNYFTLLHSNQINREINKENEIINQNLKAQYDLDLSKFQENANEYYEGYCKDDYIRYQNKCLEIRTKIQDIDNKYNTIKEAFEKEQRRLKELNSELLYDYEHEKTKITDYFSFILEQSFYPFVYNKNIKIEYIQDSKILLIEYELPNITQIPKIKGFKYYKTKDCYKKIELSTTELTRLYDDILYKITIRSIAEIFQYDNKNYVDTINFNGMVSFTSKETGIDCRNCILSIQIKKEDFSNINLSNIDAKSCFKFFKGVGSAKLSDTIAIIPIMDLNRNDKRFIMEKKVNYNQYTNLATIAWEDFEQLIRELFNKEFNQNGGEVKVTQSSRDGGVDAIAFDPDPIRGGKIVIQAKRYCNTVGVSAVRDLYGTVINEGANKGILITTSDYGSDSYNFAKDKPITLLNGGHLLYLLNKYGQKARIDLQEAKKINSSKTNYK